MLWGVFVHSATVGDFGVIALVQQSSNLFRMALFFMISGFLGSLLLERQTWNRFWAGRMRNLLVPLLFGLLVLNPPTLWLVYAHFNEGPVTWGRIWYEATNQNSGGPTGLSWHLHLWFLISLLFYVLIAPLVIGILRGLSSVLDEGFFTKRLHRLAAPWIAVAIIALGTVTLRVAVEGTEAFFGQMPWLVRVTATYLPFYLFGMLLQSSPALQSAVLTPSWLLGGTVVAFYLASRNLWFDNLVASAISESALGAMRAWLSITFISFGQRWISGRNRLSDLFSRSIYTVYILHYGIIYLLVFLLEDRVSFQSPSVYLGLGLTTTVLGLLFHSFIVARSRTLTFLLNGRLTRPKAVAS